MIRPRGRGKNIAVKVLGKNPVLKRNNGAFPTWINRRLRFEENSRVR